MRLALLYEIHGDLRGLTALWEHLESWRPDEVVRKGDVVSRGLCGLDRRHRRARTLRRLPRSG